MNPVGVPGFDQAAAAAEAARQATYASFVTPVAGPAWSNGTTYPAGAFVTGSDGVTYKSLAAGNQGNNPTTDGGAHWQPMTFAAIQAGMRAADIAYHTAIVAAGRSFNVATINSATALIELGVSPINMAN